MIVSEAVTVAHAGVPALRDASFTVPEGELVLVVGPTGSGKTSLLQCLGGRPAAAAQVTGRVLVDGVDLRDRSADGSRALVGLVRQDPAAEMMSGTVESVIAAGVRPRADDPHAGQRQVEESLDLLGLATLRDRPVAELSGGQQQRVAIGAALAAGPRVLVLDEPTSALDPVAAEEVLAILHRLVHDVGITVVVAEHRLERVVHHADSVLLVEDGLVTGPFHPAAGMARSTIRPPVVELGLRLGWTPLPLSVRAARRQVRGLRATLAAAPAAPAALAAPTAPAPPAAGTQVRVEVQRLSLVRGDVVALRTVTLQVRPGEVVALMGRNGAGKSSLLGILDGALQPTSGRTAVSGRSGLAPQDPKALLTDATVDHQLSANDEAFMLPAGATSAVLEHLAPRLARDRRPAELSEGQRMCVALSLVLARGSEVVLLDEPTRGLDYPAKARLTILLTDLAEAGRAIIVATHDVELAAEVATRAVILAEGEVVADGPARRILSDSPAFAPQVAKIMAPLPLLRVSDVAAAATP
ncbi:ABC transporter ATP-binding protein [Pedococcus bigeumensis]|uniref:ATP-binding cassette domain-containing protein n=1 Tax=Pedococcus bigeumensis TaxID=433644 RepID=A0A502CYI6_9MICO|nr:ABC transporter ATP-binding protein [Pedococcus bigeumensis]TPG18337.1 ATP-binding cassette domain-containing protein [Pedococcus bigeumensis]